VRKPVHFFFFFFFFFELIQTPNLRPQMRVNTLQVSFLGKKPGKKKSLQVSMCSWRVAPYSEAGDSLILHFRAGYTTNHIILLFFKNTPWRGRSVAPGLQGVLLKKGPFRLLYNRSCPSSNRKTCSKLYHCFASIHKHFPTRGLPHFIKQCPYFS